MKNHGYNPRRGDRVVVKLSDARPFTAEVTAEIAEVGAGHVRVRDSHDHESLVPAWLCSAAPSGE